MSYVSPNYKHKERLKEALKRGDPITVFQPGLGTIPDNGKVFIEGPHHPRPHTWYATGTMKDEKLIKVS